MSCEYDGYNQVDEWRHHRARKEWQCCACRERILPGHRYAYHVTVYDGELSSDRYCLRCEAMLEHLQQMEPEPGWGPDPHLLCGHSYQSIHDCEPPEHIAALAFWIPGEPLPKPEAT